MDIGLLILRVTVGGLIFGHAMQKLLGWYGGVGPAGTAPAFESWGLRPGRVLVRLAAVAELLAATSLALGLLNPLGAAAGVGTLAVAASINAAKGLWAQKGGYELALLYANAAVALGFTGPGQYSLDRVLGLEQLAGVAWGLSAVVAGFLGAGVMIAYAGRNKRANGRVTRVA